MDRSIRISLCTILLVVACAPRMSAPAAEPPLAPPGPALRAVDDGWVDRTLASLSLRRKVAQLLMPRIRGGFLPTEADAYDRVRAWVVAEGVGGLIASVGPPLEAAVTFNALQGESDLPLLIAADFEQGAGQIMNGGVILPYGLENGGATRFPPAMAIGASRDERHAYELGRVTALEGRAIGVHLAFAPVADVNNNPANPIINTRSYGADPAAAARFVAAHVRGLQEHGMLATAKHFPGYGDTHSDSHIELPVIDVTRARADSIELPPFRAAIDAGVTAIMTAHIAFPALTGDSVPATLNPAAIDGLLRGDLGFDGLVVTDAMDMGAIVRRYGVGQAAVLALNAGADIILQVPGAEVSRVIDAIVEAVRTGQLSEARIEQSVRRVLEAKTRLELHTLRTVDIADIPARVATRDHLSRAEAAAQRSITLVRDRDGLLPLRARRILSIAYSDDTNPFAGTVFQRTLAERIAGVETARLDSTASPAQLNEIAITARDADVVVFAPFVRVTPYKAELGVASSVAAAVRQIAASRPVIVAAFGNPYLLGQFDEVGTYLIGWGDADASQRAAALALAGDRPIAGSLPIPIPPDHAIGTGIVVDHGVVRAAPASPLQAAAVAVRPPLARAEDVGMDPTLTARIDSIMRIALVEAAAPGAAVAVGRHGQLVHLRGYGRLDPRDGFGAVDDSTIYDLASLTKVVATTTAAMMLFDEGRLSLDAPVIRYLPEFGDADPAKRTITVRNLLLHDSGLPAYAPLYREIRGRHAYLDRIAKLPLQAPPGERTVYSDFSAILLGLIVERISGHELDVFAQQRIFGPLGMRDTGFNPIWWTDAPALAENGDVGADEPAGPVRSRVAPTERDTLFRLRYLQGNVHDENAYALGGVAGHAGLFSSARDLTVFAQLMLDGGTYDGSRLVREETVRMFTRRASDRSSRALGWDTPSASSSAGDYFSARSFGHTGFTGTSLWIDPERDVFLVILTNRVNPSRDNQRHVELRRDIADAVQRAIQDMPLTKRPEG